MSDEPAPHARTIARLAEGLTPVRPRRAARDALLLGGLGVAELALFLALGFMRPDMPEAMERPSFWWKLCSTGLVAAGGAAVAVLSLDPARSPRRGLRVLGGLAAACLLLGWLLDAGRDGWGPLAARLDWHGGVQCLGKMVALSLPAVAALGVLMRRGATTDAGPTALAAGLAAGGWGAFVFVFSCPYDDPLYIAVWYGLGCAVIAGLARAVLPAVTRW